MSVKCDVCTCGKHYLSKGNTIESELADTGGSTATPLHSPSLGRPHVCPMKCHYKSRSEMEMDEKA